MKFKAIIWKHYKLKDGTHPIKIRITAGDKVTYFPLDFHVKPVEFDSKAGRVKDGHRNAQAINMRILKTLQEIEKKHIEDPEMNATDIMAKGTGSDSFYYYFNKRLDFLEEKFGRDNFKKNKAIRNKMLDFAPELKIKHFNLSFLKDFEQYLLKNGNHINTVVDNMSRISTVADEIVADGKLLYHENPFLKYKISAEDINRERLDIEEIYVLEGLKLEKGTWDYNAKNFYLFSFYTGGIRFGDFFRLLKTSVKDGRLKYFMRKRARTNKKERDIYLLPQALAILELYKDVPGKFLFPLQRAKYKSDDARENHRSSLNTLTNKALKRVSKKAELSKDISFHTSRHSIADYLVKMGVDMRMIQEILGHSRMATTEKYTKNSFPEQTEAAMKKLFKPTV